MKLRAGYGNYYVYIKNESDYLKKNYALNVLDLKMELNNVFKYLLGKNNEILFKPNNKPLLQDEVYTDGKIVYTKDQLDNINTILEVLKKNTLYPLIDDVIINEPIHFNIINQYVKSGILTNTYNPNRLVTKIIEELVKVVVIENNRDKDFITNDLGIKIPLLDSGVPDIDELEGREVEGFIVDKLLQEEDLNNKRDIDHIDTVYLEDEYMLDSVKYAYYISDLLEEELNIVNKELLSSTIIELSNKIETKLMNIIDKTDISYFSIETKLENDILIIYKYLPYSSLRSKIAYNLKDKYDS